MTDGTIGGMTSPHDPRDTFPTHVSPGPVLMADDDPDDRELVRLAFAEHGWGGPIEFVEDGEQLLERLHAPSRHEVPAPPLPSLILLDLNMPRVDGREALAQIKRDALLRDIPVVILSTSRMPEDRVECARLGAAGFVSKPSTFDDLLKVVAALRELVA